MTDEQDASSREAVLARLYDQLLADLDADAGQACYADLHALIGELEWALSRCRHDMSRG